MSSSKLFTYIEALFAVIVWGASFIATKLVKDDSALAICASRQSYACTRGDTDSEQSEYFCTSLLSKIGNRRKSQNSITLTCRLSVADRKRKSRRSTTAPAQTIHQSLQP